MAAWVVRSNPSGGPDTSALFEANSVAGIGWPAIEENISGKTQEEIKDKLRATHQGASERSLSSWAGSINRFVNQISEGDLILTPPKGTSDVLIGRCQGGYEHSPRWPSQEYLGNRRVSWFPRSKLSASFQRSVTANLTVFNINQHTGELASLLGEVESNSEWDAFITWAKWFYERPEFDEEERDYKLETGNKLAAVKEAIKDGASGWEDLLKESFISSNLTGWRIHQPFLDLESSRIEEALRRIWGMDAPASMEDRVRSFQELGPFGTPGVMASFLLMADSPTDYPIYRPTPIQNACKLTGHPPCDSTDAWERYSHALDFFDEFVTQASARDLNIRDRLDAQSLVWYITTRTPEDLPEYVSEAFESYRQGNNLRLPPTKPEPTPPSTDPWAQSNIDTLAEDLLWEPNYLQEIIEDLQEKRQVIFYGPPGTGKTYVAREIARQCKLNGGDFEIVQFHPSYSYEDFVEGYRPVLTDTGQPAFKLVQGPLRRIADKARNDPDATFILIIDELNRGNVAKVFGELYFLLEYRDEEVRLQYGGDGAGFSLPSNLWFICTMNTADRSIALMDAALRRRFYFAPFFPDEPPVKGLLHRWLEREGQDTLAANLVDAANGKLERDMGIGPSYFMRRGQTLDEIRGRRIWDRAVIPYIEEQFFGDADKLAEFRFDRLKRELNGSELNGGASTSETDTAQADDDTANTC